MEFEKLGCKPDRNNQPRKFFDLICCLWPREKKLFWTNNSQTRIKSRAFLLSAEWRIDKCDGRITISAARRPFQRPNDYSSRCKLFQADGRSFRRPKACYIMLFRRKVVSADYGPDPPWYITHENIAWKIVRLSFFFYIIYTQEYWKIMV